MAKKYRNLISLILEDRNIRRAYARTSLGRRGTYGYHEFKEHAEANLARLREDILSGRFQPDPVRHFMVFEPKPRNIEALSFRDRVAHHALVNVIGPIFEATFLPRSFACRAGMGSHAGVKMLQADLRRSGATHFLKTDFSRYFASIDRPTLHRMIRRKISCAGTLDLIERFTPREGCGLPIGALTSQLFANVYGSAADRFLHEVLGRRLWYRYMDDIVVLGDDIRELRAVKDALETFAADELHLRFSHWSTAPISRGINFLGYRIWPTHKLLRRRSVKGARRKLRRLRAGGDPVALQAFAGSWRGHAEHADSHHLLQSFSLEKS
ncbi:retron-type reverse transcriptase [Parvibaculum indicum]|uniref:reverse transcriptase/maturase family protein n=1 Tax=Parvibaculum indicum TaxID=562969 RepID=UPI00141E4650|nr:reverse transcriptase/maturase family protein [Parvibaculum indicum]NIJ40354.1 retron-type reverse transcriptase [Parvibaculum indicum]